MRIPTTGSRALDASHAFCHEQAKRHARSFYFASIALPKDKQRAAYAVYAFCRYADDLVDAAAPGADRQSVLTDLAEDFDRMSAGDPGDSPFAPAFAWAVQRYRIEKQPFVDLLKGVSMDLGEVRIADWPQLRDYCYHVASVVGLMMARIFELRDEDGLERAVELGIAMQLTNIIRDVGEDYRMKRIYLPGDEMEAHGVIADDLAAPRSNARLKSLLRAQIDRARDYYRRSEAGIPLLADDGSQFTVWLMRHVYAGILEEVERADYEVLHRRVSTSLPRKLALAARAWRDYRRHRIPP